MSDLGLRIVETPSGVYRAGILVLMRLPQQKTTEIEMNYNGWQNRETWLVTVWFGDAWEYESDVDNTKEFLEDSIYDLPSWIQDFIDKTRS